MIMEIDDLFARTLNKLKTLNTKMKREFMKSYQKLRAPLNMFLIILDQRTPLEAVGVYYLNMLQALLLIN